MVSECREGLGDGLMFEGSLGRMASSASGIGEHH